MFEEITIAGPGFINFKVSKTFYRNFLENFLRNLQAYGSSKTRVKSFLNTVVQTQQVR